MQGRNSWVGVQFCWAKNVIQQKITKILLKNCTNFDMLVNRTSPPPPNNFGKRYSLATEMSVGHKLCHTLLVRQNKLTPHPVVIPRLRPYNHDDLLGTIWKSRFNSSGEEALFFRFQVKLIYQH